MQVSIATRRVAISPTLRGFIRDRLTTTLRPYSTAILKARAELSDRNGGRGGGDKRCRILLTLADGTHVTGADIRANLRQAFTRALDAAAGATRRRIRTLVHK